MKKTLKKHEYHLNQLYADIYSEEQAVEHFIYLTSNQRKLKTTEANIRKHYVNHELGSLLRKFDPIAFNLSIEK